MLGGSTLITRSGFPGSAVVYIPGQAGACCAPTQAGVFEVGSFSISFETAYQAAFGIMIGGAGNTLHGPGMSVLRDINIEGPQYGVFAYASGVGSTLDRIAMHRIQVTAQPSSSTFTYGMLFLATNGGVIGELNCYDVQLDISRNSAVNSTAFRFSQMVLPAASAPASISYATGAST